MAAPVAPVVVAAPVAVAESDLAANIKRLFLSGEFSDLTVTCENTYGYPAQQFRVHKLVLGSQSEVLRSRMMPNKNVVHIPGFPASVVRAMMRYFYYNALNMSTNPLSVAHLIFILQLVLISIHYRVGRMTTLAKQILFDSYKPLETAQLHIGALREIHDRRYDDAAGLQINSIIRTTLQRRFANNLHAFMAYESFRILMQDRPDIMFNILRMVAGTAPE